MNINALYKIGYGLYVLTAKQKEKDNGCIINTLMQVTSFAPFLGLISLSKQNYTHQMIQETKEFNVSMLTQKTPYDVFKHFGFQSGKNVDKFNSFKEVQRSQNGLLYLSKWSNAYVSCRVMDEIDFQTHTVFKVEIVDAVELEKETSMTYDYYQQYTKPKPQKTEIKKGYRCTICNYIYEGEILPADYICPVCKHGAADFVKL